MSSAQTMIMQEYHNELIHSIYKLYDKIVDQCTNFRALHIINFYVGK